jgi:hypothetical protein
MHPNKHSLPFPARETSNDEKGGVEVFFPSKKSQTTQRIGSSCCKTKINGTDKKRKTDNNKLNTKTK